MRCEKRSADVPGVSATGGDLCGNGGALFTRLVLALLVPKGECPPPDE
jgi:hypothetical protein